MGEGSDPGRVGSGQTFCRQSRVRSGQRSAGSGWVGSKESDPWTTLRDTDLRSWCRLMEIIIQL